MVSSESKTARRVAQSHDFFPIVRNRTSDLPLSFLVRDAAGVPLLIQRRIVSG